MSDQPIYGPDGTRDHIADSILDQLIRSNWTVAAVDEAITAYTESAAIWDRAQAYNRAEDALRGIRMLLAIRDEGLDREAFRRRFVYREGART